MFNTQQHVMPENTGWCTDQELPKESVKMENGVKNTFNMCLFTITLCIIRLPYIHIEFFLIEISNQIDNYSLLC